MCVLSKFLPEREYPMNLSQIIFSRMDLQPSRVKDEQVLRVPEDGQSRVCSMALICDLHMVNNLVEQMDDRVRLGSLKGTALKISVAY